MILSTSKVFKYVIRLTHWHWKNYEFPIENSFNSMSRLK